MGVWGWGEGQVYVCEWGEGQVYVCVMGKVRVRYVCGALEVGSGIWKIASEERGAS